MKTPIRAIAAAALLTALAGCASTTATTAPSSPAGNGGSASVGAPSDSGSSASSGTTSPSSGAPTSSSSPTAPTPASPPSSVNPGGPISGQVPLPPVRSTAPNGDRVVYVSPEGIGVGSDGRTLSTSVEWGGCQEQPQLVVFTQDAKQVVVEVKTVTHYKVGVMCPNIERTGTVTATLAAPLASRSVIDGVSGRPVASH